MRLLRSASCPEPHSGVDGDAIEVMSASYVPTIRWLYPAVLLALLSAAPSSAAAQSVDVLHNFSGRSFSEGPQGSLLVASDGQIYGTTMVGGTYSNGSIFRMTPSGSVTVLHSFGPVPGTSGGSHPNAALIQATDG